MTIKGTKSMISKEFEDYMDHALGSNRIRLSASKIREEFTYYPDQRLYEMLRFIEDELAERRRNRLAQEEVE